MTPLLLTAIFLPLALMPLLAMAGARLGSRCGWLALPAPLVSTAIIAGIASGWSAGGQAVVTVPWIPSLGLDLTFLVDGLSLFFGLVVSGMGALVVWYARAYLDDHYEHHGRFYAYLLLFMTAMLGTVFAGNLMLLFVFWELTGISSFLLIGFLHGKEDSRAGARMALLVTGGTGLAMLAGIVVLGLATNTYDLAALLNAPRSEWPVGVGELALVLILVGAFGKSAQFPFHFWLPTAMAAPTPVSAYLHSATMVKLGVFLVARIFPLFSELPAWTPLLTTIGFGTMALAGLFALLSHDLKAILAYSTVLALGALIGFYGLGGPRGVQGDLLHIASHVFFKGGLFMVAGIVDHATGKRDVRELSGLGKKLPLLAAIAVAAGASMAGLPGTLGFVSKEYMLKGAVAFHESVGNAWPLALMVIAFTLKVAFSLRLLWAVFGGKPKPAVEEHFHAPGFALQFAPLLLAAACLIFGFAPNALGAALDRLAVAGLHGAPLAFHALPTKWAAEVLWSLVIMGAGALIFFILRPAVWVRLAPPRWLRADEAFEAGVALLPRFAKGVTRALRSDHPLDYLPMLLGAFVLLVGGFLVTHGVWPRFVWAELAASDPLRSWVVLVIAIAAILVVGLRGWAPQLISLSIVGFLITFYYVLFRAPDLAMTQILVESASLLLVLLLLARFPRSAETKDVERPHAGGRVRHALSIVLAVGVGLLTTVLTALMLSPRHPEPAGGYFLANSVPLAKGTNAVNTILVDFRGFDTLLEITVLLIATLGALGLLMRYRRTAEEYAQGAHGPAGFGIGPDENEKKPEARDESR
jgi:multicomponent K+:H+ antiporter subunit A/multicomponent Na+:H+ antiporter subunit A